MPSCGGFSVTGFLDLHPIIDAGDLHKIRRVLEQDADIEVLFGDLHDFAFLIVSFAQPHACHRGREDGQFVPEQALDGGQGHHDLAVRGHEGGAAGQLDRGVRAVLFLNDIKQAISALCSPVSRATISATALGSLMV